MPEPQVEWLDISPKLREAVETFVDKWLHILPSWCHHLRIREGQNDAEPECLAEFSINNSYLMATLSVFPKIVAQADIEGVIVHEFCHAYTTPPAMVARQYVQDLKPADSERETLWRRIGDHEEQATCELECLVRRLAL